MTSEGKAKVYSVPVSGTQGYPTEVTPEMDRHNLRVFSISYVLIYFAAPILYVGVVQAALCNRLGASAAVANLPATGFGLGFLAPFVLACLVPYRLEKKTMVISSFLTATSAGITCLSLFLPFSNTARIVFAVGQGTITGFTDSIATVYRYQCLGRGTTEKGRARTLKVAFTIGPMCAVCGSLVAQFVLNKGISFLHYPYDFGFVYLIATVCMLGVALLSGKYEIIWVKEERRPSFGRLLTGGVRSFVGNKYLLFLWIAAFFWSCGWNSMPTLSLYTGQVMGRPPQEFSGLIMAIRFACKSLAGFMLGILASRLGIRMPLLAVTILTAAGILWAWATPDFLVLIAFGLLGAGELGTPYFNNYVVSVSPPSTGARNLALINLAPAAAAISPLVYGVLADHFGFRASFVFGIGVALISFGTLFKLPRGISPQANSDSDLRAESVNLK